MRPTRLLLLAAAVAALAACSRDLNLPAPNNAPGLRSYSPTAAYAGQKLTISGSGFDADPSGNLVQFAKASARAESASGGSLVVRVPNGAGSGPFTVTTRYGVSAPSPSSFEYLGRGELQGNTILNTLPLLHKPYRVIGLRDETFIHSDLILGLLRYGDPAFVDGHTTSEDLLPDPSGAGTVYWLESGVDPSGNTTFASVVVRQGINAAGVFSTQRKTAIDYAYTGPLVVVRAGGALTQDAVAVIHDDAAIWQLFTGTPAGVSHYSVILYRASDLALYPGWPAIDRSLGFGLGVEVPYYDLRGCVDSGAGDLACLGRDPNAVDQRLTLFRVHLTATGATFATLTPPAIDLVENGTLPADPLCADPASRRAAVALTDGRVAVANLATPAFTGFLDTGSRTPVRWLTCLRGGYLEPGGATTTTPGLVVSKRDDNLVVRMDLPAAGPARTLWAATVTQPSASGVGCSSGQTCATQGAVHVAGESDNKYGLLSLQTGALLARRTFDVLPGRLDNPQGYPDFTGQQGATWYQTPGTLPHLALATSAPPGVVEWPLTAQRGSGAFPIFRDRPTAIGTFSWSDRTGYSSLYSDGLFPSDGTVQLAVDAGPDVYFATSVGLESFDWGYWNNGISGTWSLGAPRFTALTLMPNGDVLASVRTARATAVDPPTWKVLAWTPQQALGGLAPDEVLVTPRDVIAVATLDGQAWAFWWDPSYGSLRAQPVRANHTLGPDQILGDSFYSILAISPNGRTFVSWDYQPFSLENTSVVIWSVDAAGTFTRRATIPVAGVVTGADFDGAGERLYVVTRNPDRIVELE